jgi:hypothetical protein
VAKQSAVIITDVPLPQTSSIHNVPGEHGRNQCFKAPIGTRSTCQNGRAQCWHSYVVTKTRSSPSHRVCPSSTACVHRDSQYTQIGVVETGFRFPIVFSSGRKTKKSTMPKKMNFTAAIMSRMTRILPTRRRPSLPVRRSLVEQPLPFYRTPMAGLPQIRLMRMFVLEFTVLTTSCVGAATSFRMLLAGNST